MFLEAEPTSVLAPKCLTRALLKKGILKKSGLQTECKQLLPVLHPPRQHKQIKRFKRPKLVELQSSNVWACSLSQKEDVCKPIASSPGKFLMLFLGRVAATRSTPESSPWSCGASEPSPSAGL